MTITCVVSILQDAFILDVGTDIFLWVGNGCSHEEKKGSMSMLHVSRPRPLCLILCFRSEIIQNLMREGSKNIFKKKNIVPIFGKVNKGDTIKKTF